TGDGQAGAAGLADVAGDKVQVVDASHAIGAVSALVDAHGPDAHGGSGVGIQTGDVADGVFVDATDAGSRGWIVVLDYDTELLEAAAVGIDIGLVVQSFLQDHVRQAVEQDQVRAGSARQVDIGKLRKHGDARVDHDDRKAALLQRFLQPPVDDRMLLR